MEKNVRIKGVVLITILALMLSMIPDGNAYAAKKTKLKTKSVTLTKGKSKTIALKNRKKTSTYTFKSKNKRIATVTKKGKVTAKKVGNTTITVKESFKKNKKKTSRTVGKVKVKVVASKKTVKTTAKPTDVPTTAPTAAPPTPIPTQNPTRIPPEPTTDPTREPTASPTVKPSPTPIEGAIFYNDFETNMNGVTSRGGVTLTRVGGAYNGSYCLKVSGRTDNWHGANIDLTKILVAGEQYQVKGWVKQDGATNQNVYCKLQYTDAEGTKYPSIKTISCKPNEWTELDATFEVPLFDGSAMVYFEGSDSYTGWDFYLDDVAIIGRAMDENVTGVLNVDMGDNDRALKHGAAGFLYGLGGDEVPTKNTLTALKPHTVVQKAPNGMQHPNGDVLDTYRTFKHAGGKNVQIYVPDFYALWYYEFTGPEYYINILKAEAQACIDKGIAEDVEYSLFNEPNENWVGDYVDGDGNKVTGWNSVFWLWKDMVDALREVYAANGIESEPKTAGLSLAWYQETVMDRFIKFCLDHDCLPTTITWHDLSTEQFSRFGSEYNHYRSLEAKYGLEPKEIVINEYASQEECSSPGNLVRWIGLFEDYNVAGCLPFWHLSNNLNGLAADTNEGTGAWWLYKWYGDMSGAYLPVTVSSVQKADFYGVASLDEEKKSSNVIFGGKKGDATIHLNNLNETEAFVGAEKLHVQVKRTDYTGFHGVASEPPIILEGTLAVTNGTVTIPMSGLNEKSAYLVTVTLANDEEETGLSEVEWKAVYEAEKGTFTGSASAITANNWYACSNKNMAGGLSTTRDTVSIDVEVPETGYYKYDMVYCAGTGVNTNNPASHNPVHAIQTLKIDGNDVAEMKLATTLNSSMGGMYSDYVYMERGSHTITIGATASTGKANVDCIYLTYVGEGEEDTKFNQTYEAELGEFNELKETDSKLTVGKDDEVGYLENLDEIKVMEGGGVRFNVVVPDNGIYSVNLRYRAETDTKANVYVGNDALDLSNLITSVDMAATDGWVESSATLFLQKGINVIDIDAEGDLKLDTVRVAVESERTPVATVEAESGVLTGEASLGTNAGVKNNASESGYVNGIKAANDVEIIPEGDPEFSVLGLGRVVDKGEAADKNSLTISVTVPTDGIYNMVVYQSNGELFGKHSYNAQLTERYASFSVNGEAPVKMVFRNTYSFESFKPQVLKVNLKQGENEIKIFNDNSRVITNGVLKAGQSEHRPENIDYNALTNYTPCFDKFTFYPER